MSAFELIAEKARREFLESGGHLLKKQNSLAKSPRCEYCRRIWDSFPEIIFVIIAFSCYNKGDVQINQYVLKER